MENKEINNLVDFTEVKEQLIGMYNFNKHIKVELKPLGAKAILDYIDIKDKEIKQLKECLKEIDLIIYRLRFVEFLDRDSCIRTLNNVLKDIRYISQTEDYKTIRKEVNNDTN